MTKEELIRRLKDIEWEDFEVKEARSELPKNIWETVSAFSNTSGGWIILGIRQKGKGFEVTGVDNAEKLEQDFLSTLRSQKFNTRLSVGTGQYDISGKKVLAFHIPSSVHKPVYFGSPANTFIRIGSVDQHATENEIMAMYHDQSFGIRSELAIPETDTDMLNPDSLHSYRNYLKTYNTLSAYEGLNDPDFCRQLSICNKNGELTYAGLLMFGKGQEVLRHVPTFCMDYVEIPGRSVAEADTRYSYRAPEQENLWETYQVVIRRLLTLADRPFRLNRLGVAEDDGRQFEIMREAWVNMLMHTDHFSPLRSCVHVFTDRIEFLNAGSFPIPPEKIYGTLYSSARNPTIAKLFRLAKLAENIGFGIDRLLSWKQLTGQNVNIRSERDFVCVTLYFNSDVVENIADDVVENVVSNVVEKLNDRQNKIIELLRQEPTLSASQLAQQVSSTLRTVQRDLARLRYLGIISRTGSDKKGFWTITNNRHNKEIWKEKLHLSPVPQAVSERPAPESSPQADTTSSSTAANLKRERP